MKNTTKKKSIDIMEIFKFDAIEIIKSREECFRLHGTDIRAAGNEVEICVRNFFQRMLPSKYFVTHGHLIDEIGSTSCELDIIISDGYGLPSLLTTADKTSFVPIDSTYAIGEIKSTYYKSASYIEKFINQLTSIKKNLLHHEIENSIYEGLDDKSNMRDIFLCKSNRILNSIFSFMIFVDSGDFDYSDIVDLLSTTKAKYLPNMIIFLNKGVLFPGNIDQSKKTYFFRFYPEDKEAKEYIYTSIPIKNNGSLEGNHLGFLYLGLINHLSNSYLEPPLFDKYLSNILHNNPMKVQSIKINEKENY